MAGRGREPIDEPSEEEASAIRACQKGDRNAYELIVRHYAARAIGAARAILRDASLAEDAAQEAFVRAFRAIRRFRVGEPFYPWLYRILKNVCLTTLRRRGNLPAASLDSENAPPVPADTPDPGAAASRSELRAMLLAAMAQLSDAHREILYLAHFDELSYKEIAACLAIPLGTVMSRLWAARQALRKVVSPSLKDHG